MPKKPTKLTLRHAKILIEMTEYAMTHGGRLPTVRQLLTNCGYKSTSAIGWQLTNLENMGYITSEQIGSIRYYYLKGISINPPPWFYEVKALYLDRTLDTLDVDWNAKLERV